MRWGPSPCLQECARSPSYLSHITYACIKYWGHGALAPPEYRSQWTFDLPSLTLLPRLYEEDDDGRIYRSIFDPLAPISFEESGYRAFLHGGEEGHVELITDDVGAIVGYTDYFPFDEISSTSGITKNIGFSGKMFDDISRLYYFGTRHYAIEIGRFISPDPLIFMNFSRAITNPLAGIKSLKFEKTLKYKVRELYDMLHHHK